MNTLIGEKDRRKRGEKGKQEVPLRTSEGEREGILSIHCCSHVVSLSLSLSSLLWTGLDALLGRRLSVFPSRVLFYFLRGSNRILC